MADCTHPTSAPKAAVRQSGEQSDSDQQRKSLSWNPTPLMRVMIPLNGDESSGSFISLAVWGLVKPGRFH